MFAARPGDALVLAERVLATDPPLASGWRAQTARIAGLAHADRSREAVVAADDLVVAVSSGAVGPYAQGLAHAIAAMARLASWDEDRATSTDPSSGRWPVPAAGGVEPPDRGGGVAPHRGGPPAVRGSPRPRHQLAPGGGRAAARRRGPVPLRSGHVAGRLPRRRRRPRRGRGPPARNPAGRARRVPGPRRVGSGGRRRGPRAPDGGRRTRWRPPGQAIAAGSMVSSVAYLAEAARLGAAGRAAELLDGLDREIHAPVTAARAVGIRARATGDGRALLDAAEQHMAIGLLGPAAELAALAVAALGRGPVRARDRAQALVAEGRQRRHDGTPTTEPVLPLTAARARGGPARRQRHVRSRHRSDAGGVHPDGGEPPGRLLPQARHHLTAGSARRLGPRAPRVRCPARPPGSPPGPARPAHRRAGRGRGTSAT